MKAIKEMPKEERKKALQELKEEKE